MSRFVVLFCLTALCISDNHESVKFVVWLMNAWGKSGETIESVSDAYWSKVPLYPF